MEFQIKSIKQQFGCYVYEVNFVTNFGYLDGEVVFEEVLEFNKTYKIKFDYAEE